MRRTDRARERLIDYAKLLRLHRPIGTMLLLWPTLWALFIAAHGWPGTYVLFAFSLGTLLMRSAGCAINDFADRDFDGAVKRTRDRPLAAGRIASWEAVMLFVVISLLALPLIAPFGRLTWLLAVVAAVLAGTYPFFKRFFAIPQAYLGIAFGFGIPMGFAAVRDALPLSCWMLLAANIAWTIAYDTEYAMVDRDDDLKIGIRTSAITFGRHDVTAVMVCYALALVLLGVVGVMEGLGPGFAVGLLLAAGVAGYHYTLIRDRDRDRCFRAFNHNTWFGAAVFGGVLLGLQIGGYAAQATVADGRRTEFAFAIGGEVRPGDMTAGHLALMAKELGMEPRFLVQQARDVAALVPGAIGQAARDIAPALAPSARTLADRLVRFVSVNCRKLTARLADD